MKISFVWVVLLVAAVSLGGLWKYQRTKAANVNYLQITTTNSPVGKSLLPEQRRMFALKFEKKFKDKFIATVTTIGDFHTSLLIQGDMVNEPLVLGMKDNDVAMQELRKMGFKHLIMTNGKISWDIDLKN